MGECMVDEIHALKLENQQLQETVEELRDQLKQSTGPVLKCGYLYKHRPWALRFFEKQWQVRFFSLTRTTLSYWKSEAEVGKHPRGKYVVDREWIVRMEGVRDGKDPVLVIEDAIGSVVLRLSAGQPGETRSWLNALTSIGCSMVVKRIVSSGNNPRTLRQRKSSQNGRPSQKQQQQQDQQQSFDEKSLMYTMRPSNPVHRKTRDSPLSSDEIFKQSHVGLFNLCIVVLLAVNSRLIIENLMKYGLVIQTGFFFSSKSWKDWPLLMCGMSLPVFPLAAYLVEKLKVRRKDASVWCLHVLNLVAALGYPIYVIEKFGSDVLSGVLLMLSVLTGWMKLVSYAHTNADTRLVIASGGKIETPAEAPQVNYPDNISLKNMVYFMFAPTLCYQMSYPQSKGIRKGWVFRQLGKLLVFNGLMGFIIGQYSYPIIKNSTHPLKSNFLSSIERVLKLSIPTLYVWLGFFYCFFHLWLNMLAEVLRFGDREFYKDWWNAKTIDEYWRLWNMPVRKWLVRHVYFPCLRLGFHRWGALVVVFVISGVFHEMCIAIPCHLFRGWAFLGIMLQVPLVYITNILERKFQSSMVGNMIFWFFFCIVGQPMSLLLYYHDVVSRQQHLL